MKFEILNTVKMRFTVVLYYKSISRSKKDGSNGNKDEDKNVFIFRSHPQNVQRISMRTVSIYRTFETGPQ